MSKKSDHQNEFYPKCPLYSKGLETCPSSKTCLSSDDVKILLGSCVTDKYKTCKFFLGKKEKEQAA